MKNNAALIITALIASAALVLVLAVDSNRNRLHQDSSTDLARMEERLNALERRIEQLNAVPSRVATPSTQRTAGKIPFRKSSSPAAGEHLAPKANARLADLERKLSAITPPPTEPGASKRAMTKMEERMIEHVDEAVEKKAAELELKQNKKPSIEQFASILELSDTQRELVEREVVHGQLEVQEILETPTADGTNLMDELVEVFAGMQAQPREDPGAFLKWIGRVMSERVPGTDETYGIRIEAINSSLRETFRREFSSEQYAEYSNWEVKPTDIEKIEGSPWNEIGTRIEERARELNPNLNR